MEQSEIEQLVEEVETRVERLRSLYDQYFMGIERIEPQIARKDVERRIQILRTQIRNTALRFRFQNVLLRYNTFGSYWSRICRQIEGRDVQARSPAQAKARFDLQAQAKRGPQTPSVRPGTTLETRDTEPPPAVLRATGRTTPRRATSTSTTWPRRTSSLRVAASVTKRAPSRSCPPRPQPTRSSSRRPAKPRYRPARPLQRQPGPRRPSATPSPSSRGRPSAAARHRLPDEASAPPAAQPSPPALKPPTCFRAAPRWRPPPTPAGAPPAPPRPLPQPASTTARKPAPSAFDRLRRARPADLFEVRRDPAFPQGVDGGGHDGQSRQEPP